MHFQKTVLVMVACLWGAGTMAQPAQMPSDEAIRLEQKRIADSMTTMGGKTVATPTSRSIQAIKNGNSYGAAADAANEIRGSYKDVSKASREQFEKLARSGRTGMPLQSQKVKSGDSDLMIFVSLSMPPDMLTNYVRQAKRFGAVLMMRGFVNDKMSATKAAVERLNADGVEWQISPEPFKKFKVDKVPAIVLASADDAESVTQDGCATPDAFALVSGDIKVIDALDKMRLRAQPKIAKLAYSRLLADRASGKQGTLTQ